VTKTDERRDCPDVSAARDGRTSNEGRSFDDTRRLVDEYAARGKYPLDLVLNYRFIGPSKALLSPAYGPGISCYPDALCFGRTPDWEEFTAELAAAWMKDPSAIPHWAKEFEHVPRPRCARARAPRRSPRAFRRRVDRERHRSARHVRECDGAPHDPRRRGRAVAPASVDALAAARPARHAGRGLTPSGRVEITTMYRRL
jgi:hypothetical protein